MHICQIAKVAKLPKPFTPDLLTEAIKAVLND